MPASLFSRPSIAAGAAGGGGSNNVTYKTSGPVFDGTLVRQVRRAQKEIERRIGQQAVEMVRNRLNTVLVNPTGYYRSQIAFSHSRSGGRVHDSQVIYGPWLEGVGSRNKSTKFKGYGTFKKTFAEIQRYAPEIAEQVVSGYVR